MTRHIRVITAHQPGPAEPLRLEAGEEVTVGRRDDTWPAWVWCEASGGRTGWAPEAFLAREAPEFDRATVLHDYDATELDVRAGSVLEVLSEEGGWFWCRTDDGHTGWIPEADTSPA
jgi:uncharacterized protein YgiM (DUF1202 family)